MRRLALVGGSSAGIGKATAEGLLAKGVDVILTASGAPRLMAAKAELQKRFPKRKVSAIACDFSDAASVKALIAKIVKGDSPDILILNTGGPKAGNFDDISPEDWDGAYQQQFKSSLMLLKAFLPGMRRRQWGRVISVSSTVVLEPSAGMILSASYRAMLVNALKSTSLLVAKDGVTINTVCPAAVLTDRLLSLLRKNNAGSNKSEAEIIAGVAAGLPSQRIASPAEFAQTAVFLASDEASYVTGTVIPVDGGATRKSF